ncbi:lysophospholipid acyltransferase family protein [Ligilactobacillus acidipiscis]|uniref:lysophospholipid acyltransferase family protein n=1 Tax=Ligilactobacillus acidipiscis TaxID=89059 RepID=UPI00362F5A10
MIYRYVRFILGICLMIYVGRIIVKGIENLPKSGSYIIVAPHHHFIDAIVFATQIRATDFFFIAKKELFKNKIFFLVFRQTKCFSGRQKKSLFSYSSISD